MRSSFVPWAGEYLPLKIGIPTGCNPLQLPPTPANVDFLKSWLRLLAQSHAGEGAAILPVREESDLEIALRGTLALDLPERRLSRLIEFLDPTSCRWRVCAIVEVVLPDLG